MRKALEQYLLDVEGPTELGPHRAARAAPKRKQTPIEKLMQQREALVERHPWQTTVLFVAIVVLTMVGVVAALRAGAVAAIGVAIGSAIAMLFRLLQEIQRIQFRRMVFAMIQLALEKESIPVDRLVHLLLESDQFKFDKDYALSKEKG